MRRSTQVTTNDGNQYDEVVVDGAGRDVGRVRERSRWISPGRVLGGLVGVGLIAFGAVTIVRAGLDGSLNSPMVAVLGISQSAAVGLIELVVGALMLLAAADEAERPFMTFLGVAAVVAGILGLAATGDIRTTIGFGSDTAWFFIVWGAVAAVAGMLPTILRTTRDVSPIR
jgi:hypothetical protein